jgi:DHA1 family bicyclomycin/chloramphenicol resistance-like MFS transporter
VLPAVLVLLFFFVATLGFVGPNATAIAMERHGPRAGMASATLGAAQYGIVALASAVVGVANDGTMRPMAIVMITCAVAASIAAALGRRAPPEATLASEG